MATKILDESILANPSMILALQDAWEASYDAMNANEDFRFTLGDDPESQVRKLHAEDGEKEVHWRATMIQHLIVREQPLSWKDAIVHAAHLTNIGSDIDTTNEPYRADAFQSLTEGLQNLLAFIARERQEVRVGRTLQSTIDCAGRAVALRTGRPDIGTVWPKPQ